MAYETRSFNTAFRKIFQLSRINPVTRNHTYFFNVYSNIVYSNIVYSNIVYSNIALPSTLGPS